MLHLFNRAKPAVFSCQVDCTRVTRALDSLDIPYQIRTDNQDGTTLFPWAGRGHQGFPTPPDRSDRSLLYVIYVAKADLARAQAALR